MKYTIDQIQNQNLRDRILRLAEERYQLENSGDAKANAYAWARRKGYAKLQWWRHFNYRNILKIEELRAKFGMPPKYETEPTVKHPVEKPSEPVSWLE